VETTHWADLAESFKIQDAACLMAGVPPAKEMVSWSDKLPPEARYVFERLWKAYFQGAGVYKQPELNSADFQKMLHGIDAPPEYVNCPQRRTDAQEA
jgi:predicted secreted Zn-dependent protease